jgi:hypothetical protein
MVTSSRDAFQLIRVRRLALLPGAVTLGYIFTFDRRPGQLRVGSARALSAGDRRATAR